MIAMQPGRPATPRPMPATRRPHAEVRAGGTPSPASPSPAPDSAPVAMPASMTTLSGAQQLVNALTTFFRALFGWLGGLFRQAPAPAVPMPPASPLPGLPPTLPASTLPASTRPAQSPFDAPWVPLKEVSNADGSLSAGVGLTSVSNQTGIGGRIDARMGETRLQAIAAHTSSESLTETVAAARVEHATWQAEAVVRDRNGTFSAEGTLAVASPTVQAAVTGRHQGDRTELSGQLAAAIGQDGMLRAQGAYERRPETTRAALEARYTDATTDLGVRYAQENATRTVGAHLDKRFAHSTLAIAGELQLSPEGEGGKAYGRWQTDAIGERAFGYQIRGEMEAGAVKQPGQDWNTYASGRIVGEKENASFFVGVQHQQGPRVSHPQTSVNAGLQFRF